ncbi:hypothetical protein CALCODRAFT_178518 [Calocera cornea HHB12733]|uniref:Uncharacterized protein n=1 Tax=Calocera cornea HHB12733 TaxID=1353952 RepID=A0A165CDY0_9BASI|nr:hypothetical protein CALCODRAFT_178518 [Calocera cornea HHB12733]
MASPSSPHIRRANSSRAPYGDSYGASLGGDYDHRRSSTLTTATTIEYHRLDPNSKSLEALVFSSEDYPDPDRDRDLRERDRDRDRDLRGDYGQMRRVSSAGGREREPSNHYYQTNSNPLSPRDRDRDSQISPGGNPKRLTKPRQQPPPGAFPTNAPDAPAGTPPGNYASAMNQNMNGEQRVSRSVSQSAPRRESAAPFQQQQPQFTASRLPPPPPPPPKTDLAPISVSAPPTPSNGLLPSPSITATPPLSSGPFSPITPNPNSNRAPPPRPSRQNTVNLLDDGSAPGPGVSAAAALTSPQMLASPQLSIPLPSPSLSLSGSPGDMSAAGVMLPASPMVGNLDEDYLGMGGDPATDKQDGERKPIFGRQRSNTLGKSKKGVLGAFWNGMPLSQDSVW